MKRNGLLYLVIFSLALNLGTISTLVYLRYYGPPPAGFRAEPPPMHMRELWNSLNLDTDQRQALRGLFPEHMRHVHELREGLAQKRQELFDLIKSDSVPWSAIQAKVREISSLQGSLEEEMARFLLEFKKHLKPGQDAAFLNLVQTRLGRGHGSMGPRGPGHGRGWGGPRGPRGPGAPGNPE